MNLRTLSLVAVAAGVVALGAVSCAATPDVSQETVILTPDYATFAGSGMNVGVHTFLEHRCGTLDCHGQVGRPFRLFSQDGLRAANDAGIESGGAPDTPGEVYANYLSAIGLQPELISQIVAGDVPLSQIDDDLLLVAKPLDLQVHKGGQQISVGDVSYDCLTGWLTLLPHQGAGAVNASCNKAGVIP
jgi:hypothetical protein